MGSTTLLDIIGSAVIGGMLLLILLRINMANTDNLYNYSNELIVQQSLSSIVAVVEYDFRKIGYCSNFDSLAKYEDTGFILRADSNRIHFLADLNRAGVLNLVQYYIGEPTELSNTPNPLDRMLYRVIDKQTPIGNSLGVTKFSLAYLDHAGRRFKFPISNDSLRFIKAVSIDLKVENVNATVINQDTINNYILWRQVRVVAKNLTK